MSGYSRFVKETESTKGILVTSQLIEAIMKANRLGFQVSEIEGDAILFYRFGKPYRVNILLKQFEEMLFAFNLKKDLIESPAVNYHKLSIKAIAHYGEIFEYSVLNFDKLYGKVLIEAHRLLKNNIHQDTYILVTDQYLLEDTDYTVPVNSGFQQCEKYDIGKICYTFFPYMNNTGPTTSLIYGYNKS